ncbi:MAG: hypothetical protein HY402_05255 [Elusimicrobia bacterium]|nr:hypothetical protein [Elusimicrobiota bacterium]
MIRRWISLGLSASLLLTSPGISAYQAIAQIPARGSAAFGSPSGKFVLLRTRFSLPPQAGLQRRFEPALPDRSRVPQAPVQLHLPFPDSPALLWNPLAQQGLDFFWAQAFQAEPVKVVESGEILWRVPLEKAREFAVDWIARGHQVVDIQAEEQKETSLPEKSSEATNSKIPSEEEIHSKLNRIIKYFNTHTLTAEEVGGVFPEQNRVLPGKTPTLRVTLHRQPKNGAGVLLERETQPSKPLRAIYRARFIVIALNSLALIALATLILSTAQASGWTSFTVAASLASIASGLWIGHMKRKIPSETLLTQSTFHRGWIALLVPLLAHLGWLNLATVIPIGVALGALMQSTNVAERIYIKDNLKGEALDQAHNKLDLIYSGIMAAGSLLAGWLVGSLGITPIFLAYGTFHLLVWSLIFRRGFSRPPLPTLQEIRNAYTQIRREIPLWGQQICNHCSIATQRTLELMKSSQAIRKDLPERLQNYWGNQLKPFWQRPALRYLVVLSALVFFTFIPFRSTMIPLLNDAIFQSHPTSLGMLFASIYAGMHLSNWLTFKRGHRLPDARWIQMGALGLASLGLLWHPQYLLYLVTLLLAGFAMAPSAYYLTFKLFQEEAAKIGGKVDATFATGLFLSGVSLFSTLGNLLVKYLFPRLEWSGTPFYANPFFYYLLMFIPAVAALLLAPRFLRSEPSPEPTPKNRRGRSVPEEVSWEDQRTYDPSFFSP